MDRLPGRSLLIAAILCGGVLGGCAQVRDRQGFIIEDTLADAIQPGIDNRDSVTKTLGRPSFAGQFDQRDWYYISRDTRQLAFRQPRAVDQKVLHVRFDEAGNVVAVERTGMERVASIEPYAKETPTLGRDKGFFRELFGNIGAVGAGDQGARTADNPQ